MKKQFQKVIVLLGLIISSIGWAQGHVEGGGDDIPILFRQAKEQAILILRTITSNILAQHGANPNEVSLYDRYRMALVVDLEVIPPFIFCKGAVERKQFFKSDGEKTALTVHWPGAAVKINLDRCNEHHISLHSAIVLLWREAGRHVVAVEKEDLESEEEFMLRIEPTLDSLEDIAVKATEVYDRLYPSQDSSWILSTAKRTLLTSSGQPTLTLLMGGLSGGAVLWFAADRVSPGYVKLFMKVGAVLLWTVPVSLGAANADEGALDKNIYLDLVAQHHEKESALSQDPQNLNLQSDIVCLKIQILKMIFYKVENSEVENQESILQVIQAEIKTLKDRYQAIQQQIHP